MTTFPTRTATAAAGLALALTLAACSGGGPNDDDSTASERELGPLDEFFEQMYGDFDEADGNAQMIEVEEITAECMRDLGFEYTPVDYSSMGGMSMSSDDLDVEWGSKEFAEQYGYGATTNPWGDPEPAPEDGTGEEWVDPNQEYVEAMSETEQTAYYAALYGEQTFDENADPEDYEYKWEEAGCSGKAQHEVYDSGTGMDDEQFQALQDEMNTMWESVMNDPRLAEANAAWATCMADAGHTGLATTDDAQNLIYDQVNAIYEDAYADVEFDEESTDEDYAALEESVQAEIAKLTDQEIEIAVADFACREKSKLDSLQQEINIEYQKEFVEAHQDELDAWLEATKSAQG